MIEKSIENEKKGAHVSAGSYAVCVRTCDGSFFPVSYSGAGRADSLEEVCRLALPERRRPALFVSARRHDQPGRSSDGEPYVDLPNALKFQQTYDPSARAAAKARAGRRRWRPPRPDTATSRATSW